MKISTEKLAKILLLVLVMVLSITVLTKKIPETKYIKQTVEHLEESNNTIMMFSGTAIATSLAISALPDDFASPLASTVSDLNTYFIFLFAILFVEKLIVIEGTGIALSYIIPLSCLLYILFILAEKDFLKKFATKLLILGISLIAVIPISTHFTNTVCADYMAYVDETIEEANAGATKINDVMASDDQETTFFDKISDAFKNAIQDVSDLLAYFKNVIKKCVNSVAILIVTTFVLPLLILMLFRWLLKELFSLHIPAPDFRFRLPVRKEEATELMEREEER